MNDSNQKIVIMKLVFVDTLIDQSLFGDQLVIAKLVTSGSILARLRPRRCIVDTKFATLIKTKRNHQRNVQKIEIK